MQRSPDSPTRRTRPASRRDLPSRQSQRLSSLRPLRSVCLVTTSGSQDLPPEDISPESVGWKAYGLASLPAEWTPPFLVISSGCAATSETDGSIAQMVANAMGKVGLAEDTKVMVRSSGTAETIRHRGALLSRPSLPGETLKTVQDLRRHLQVSSGEVHWVVQRAVEPKHKGQFSNERHLSYESRDWVTEFEPRAGHPGYTARVAVRRWRDGTDPRVGPLPCASEPEITLRLKRVAHWATQFSSRIHFEWVWDGTAVSIVQADVAPCAQGVDPRALLSVAIPASSTEPITTFHCAGERDDQKYSKLSNARLYRTLGYDMPVFYVADEPALIKSILAGEIPEPLRRDLRELTRRPLIIRTDGADLPAEKREMLPRSDELRSQAEAEQWLLGFFRTDIRNLALDQNQLCLLAHHFIPSAASAWARAQPGHRIVRIESLWGIPEGLYWYSHDTFEVDTQTALLTSGSRPGQASYTHRQRIRYKGTFVSPDSAGKWRPVQTSPPHDWRPSITKTSWLFEIAHATRRVAEHEDHAVSLMWLIGNHPQATGHEVLPWYHCKSELVGTPKAAPRHKLSAGGDYSIRRAADWLQFQSDLKTGRRIERVVVEPMDAELIRDQQFAKELATLTASRRIVVQLAGGILSHVYYILQRNGAQVECVDLFGADEDVVEYNKLVRDKIPFVIAERGEKVETVYLRGDALLRALREKLVEEAFEALDARSGNDLVDELADIEEVVRAICGALQVNDVQLKSVRRGKRKRRGGFESGLMLRKTATPHSIQPPFSEASPGLEVAQAEPVIFEPAALPAKPVYYRPDLRQINQDLERLLTFESETNKLGQFNQAVTFSVPSGKGLRREFTVTVELRRSGASVRGVVRLRTGPEQLRLEFSDEQA